MSVESKVAVWLKVTRESLRGYSGQAFLRSDRDRGRKAAEANRAQPESGR